MYIEIEMPIECVTLEQKRAHVRSIYEWGLDNLEDQEQWQYFKQFEHKIAAHMDRIELYIENDIDGMAIKLAWS